MARLGRGYPATRVVRTAPKNWVADAALAVTPGASAAGTYSALMAAGKTLTATPTSSVAWSAVAGTALPVSAAATAASGGTMSFGVNLVVVGASNVVPTKTMYINAVVPTVTAGFLDIAGNPWVGDTSLSAVAGSESSVIEQRNLDASLAVTASGTASVRWDGRFGQILTVTSHSSPVLRAQFFGLEANLTGFAQRSDHAVLNMLINAALVAGDTRTASAVVGLFDTGIVITAIPTADATLAALDLAGVTGWFYLAE